MNTIFVQNVIRRQVVLELRQKLNTRFDIASLSFSPFSNFVLKGVYLEDQQRDTLFYAREIQLKVNLWKLLTRHVFITEASLNGIDFHLREDSTGHSDFDFVLKAFASKDTVHHPLTLSFHVTRFAVNRGRFQLTKASSHPKQAPTLNMSDLNVNDIHFDVAVQKFDADTLSFAVRSFHLKEKSGLTVDQFQTTVLANRHLLFLPSLRLRLSKSDLRMDSISFRYDSLANLSHFVKNVKIRCRLLPSYIYLSDFSAFIPGFKGYDDAYRVSTQLEGPISDFKCHQLKIENRHNFKFDGNFEINGLPNLSDAFVYANVKQMHLSMSHLQDVIADVSNRPFVLPAPALRLGTLYFTGSLTGFLSEMVAYGNFSTRLGNFRTDLKLSLTDQLQTFSYSGSLKMNNFQLGAMLNNPDLGNVTLRAEVKGQNAHDKSMTLTTNATIASITFKQYLYQNILLDGSLKNKQFDGTASIHDPNINFDIAGLINWNSADPVYQFTASLDHFRPHALHLTQKWPDLAVSMLIKANLQGNILNQANGTFEINPLQLDNQEDHFMLPLLKIEAKPMNDTQQKIIISSDLIHGTVSGKFNLAKVGDDFNYLVSLYMPSLFAKSPKLNFFNDVVWNLSIDSTKADRLGAILDLPIQLHRGGGLQGYLDSKNNAFQCSVDLPDVTIGNNHFSNLTLSCDNRNNQLHVGFFTMIHQKQSVLNFYATVKAKHDSVGTNLSWDNNVEPTFAGELVAGTQFSRIDNGLRAKIHFLPTQIMINDSAWNMQPGLVTTDFHTFQIDHVGLERPNQHFYLSGMVSKQPHDSLNIDLKGIRLEDISDLIHLENPRLNGTINGKVAVLSVLQHPIADASLIISHFGLNNTDWGENDVNSRWDGVNNVLNASVKITPTLQGAKPVVVMNGSFFPSQDSLAFNGFTHHLPIDFLDVYLNAFLSSPGGNVSGPVSLFLKNNHFWIEGSQFVQDGHASLSYLNTSYTFADSVYLREGAIVINDMKVKDSEGNAANLWVNVTNHDFKDWHYDVKVQADNILGLNTGERDNANFWGRAYASGTVHVYDKGNNAYIDINATAQRGTNMVISVDNSQSSISNSFITYVERKVYKRDEGQPKSSTASNNNSSQTIINTTFNVMPDTQVELLIDKKAGDRINANGTGLVNIRYNTTTSDIQMYGNYTVNKGNYLFTFQNALIRDFKIDNGSKIRWDGNAMNPTIDINATYQVNASLADLMDADLLQTTKRTNVLVDCMLNLTGNLLHPDIKFNIDLPNASDELKREVKNIINTDEMMNRQMIYLLAFGRFYTPDYMRSSANSFGQNELLSVATSTVSSQLNNLLSQAVKGLNLGLNWNRSGVGSFQGNDYEAAIQYQNNRWIINGNVGYRDDNFSATRFIGDIDIQYLFTKNGKWSIRAFNHTNDYKELNPSLYTQGIGLTYTENFNSFSDLFTDYWEMFKKLFNKKINKK
ncbi:MAG: translocation/assembly module TamB domain-containing protein [Microbacter sp.]